MSNGQSLDYDTLETMRRNHPAWRLLMADHAPLIISFLYRVFVVPNIRGIAHAELTAKLEDELFQLRETRSEDAFPRSAAEYLEEWSHNSRGWLRKFYPPGSDEAHFDLTPSTEKAMTWLESLTQRAFVGTESRLLTVFELLRQMVSGSESDPQLRMEDLERRKREIDAEIKGIQEGEAHLLDGTALKDRFQQFAATARDLLSDFREVEENFRLLDRTTRERIALWEGGKGDLLESVLGDRDTIADSDQGKSFRAFWDFLMDPARQEELSALLAAVFALPVIRTVRADARLKRVHHDWLDAGDHAQRTVALLSQQLRRFLDDQVWLENRRIMQVLHEIEAHALAVREDQPSGSFMELDDIGPDIELPMEKPLFSPPLKTFVADQVLEGGDVPVSADVLFDQVVVDKARLAARIRRALMARQQITLAELVAEYPLEQGLAELVTYLALTGETPFAAIFDESFPESVPWTDAEGVHKNASLPRVIFTRGRPN
ncbi:MAG: DUF3375 domain-containing protein [Peptococcaceae bacterium]|jgi:hypothetical protein|nr:DUF3375 domain-containing protein [Peptococcaceae bacterium]